MSIQDGFQIASFKGVEFLIPADTSLTTGLNNKTAVHHFINGNKPLVEYLGENGRIFSTIAFISSDDFAEYNSKKVAFEKVLNEQSNGILIHPIDGRKFVGATGILLTQDLREINIAKYNLVFTETDDKIYPKEIGSKSAALKKIDDTKEAVSNSFVSNFNALLPRIKDNFIKTKDFASNSLTKVNEIVSSINASGETLAQYTRDYQNVANNIAVLIKTPEQYVSKMQTLWGSILTITDDTLGLLNINLNLIDINPLPATGSSSIFKQIIANQNETKNLNNVNALINAYELSNDIDYGNQEELNNVIENLDEKYNIIINDLNQDTASELATARSRSFLYLESIKGKLAKTIKIYTAPTNLTVLAYKYYGDITRAEEIEKLNNTINNDYVSGELKILEF